MKLLRRQRNLKGKRVLVRVDYNVPLKKKKVVDDTRLVASVPTIDYLVEKGAKVILVSHLGRPKGEVVAAMKMEPVRKQLSALLEKEVLKLETGNWKLSDKKKLKLIEQIDNMKNGDVALMENIRFSPDEKKNTGTLSQELANLVDMFVLDGFGVAHRASASVVGVAEYVPSYAGLLVAEEVKGLDKVIRKPKSPFVVVLGGAKIETKIPVMKHMLPKADCMLLGGGLVNTYFKAKGYRIGDSLFDKDFTKEALAYCRRRKAITPVDVLVGTLDGKHHRVVDIKKKPHQICKKGEGIYDIGPKTIQLYAKYIKEAQTLVWNGAMGYFEQQPYHIGTMAIARLVASRSKGKAYGVIGGGETLQAIDIVDMRDDIDLVSTGGGAMLAYLAGEELPGLAVLN